MNRILLVDSHNLMMRYISTSHSAFYAAFKFLIQFFSTQPYHITRVIFAFDSARPKFRYKLLPSYKAARTSHPKIKKQIDQIKYILPRLAVPIALLNGYEADDCIYKIIRELPNEKFVVYSADQDFIQLDGDNVHIIKPIKRGLQRVNKPDHFMISKILLGDKSDNISGVPGIGPVKAKSIAEQVDEDDINLFLEHLDRSKYPIDPTIVERNYKLIDLKYAYDNYTHKAHLRIFKQTNNFDPNLFAQYCHKFNAQSLIIRSYYLKSHLDNMLSSKIL